MMTKQHFEAVASVVSDALAGTKGKNSDARIAVTGIAFALAEEFAQENPRFDNDRFLRACGIPV